jgi:hypothetical protein
VGGEGLEVEVAVFFMLHLHYWGRGKAMCGPLRLSLASKSLGEVRDCAHILAVAL